MKVTTLAAASGTYATILTDGVETTVRLPNGTRHIARDLLDLADASDLKAKNEARRAARLRAAAAEFDKTTTPKS